MSDNGWLPYRRAAFVLVPTIAAGIVLAQVVLGVVHLVAHATAVLYG